MKHLSLLVDRSVASGHVGIDHDDGVKVVFLHIWPRDGDRLQLDLRGCVLHAGVLMQYSIVFINDLHQISRRLIQQFWDQTTLLVAFLFKAPSRSVIILVELVERLPQLIDPRIPLSLVEVAGHRLAQIHPGLKVTERPRLALFGEIPVDSPADVNEVHGNDGRIILGLCSFVEHQEVVSMNSSAWWWSRSDVRRQLATTNAIAGNVDHQPMKHLSLLRNRRGPRWHVGIDHDDCVEVIRVHSGPRDRQRLKLNLRGRVFLASVVL